MRQQRLSQRMALPLQMQLNKHETGENRMIDFKIKKYIKLTIAPHDVRKAYRSMLAKYKALSIENKEEFEVDLDKEIIKLNKDKT